MKGDRKRIAISLLFLVAILVLLLTLRPQVQNSVAGPPVALAPKGSVAAAVTPAHTDSSRPVQFNRDVRPLLSDHCYACHGPDKARRKAGLRLDRQEDLFRTADSGTPVVAPGDADGSELIARVTSDGPDRMPPPGHGKPLSAEQVARLRRWVAEGARWQPHWAYIPPERPPEPPVKNRAWVHNAIDAFVLARLEATGLAPAPEADRHTLIRRVSLDLTGLPPTPAEVDAFVIDPSPDAYEKLVDRLLASPHYGERMALSWLDLARFADTIGQHVDRRRDMWAYRDWVIDAFNANKPFDVFTTEQLAGDMLPGATVQQRVASGFNRNTIVNAELSPFERDVLIMLDRVNTTATVWLGSSLACAQCHDHKFDPFTQKDYYRFYAFFNNSPEGGADISRVGLPWIELASTEQQAALAEVRVQLAELEGRIERQLSAVDPDRLIALSRGSAPRAVVWVEDALPDDAIVGGSESIESWHWVTKPNPVFHGEKAVVRTVRGFGEQLFTKTSQPLRFGTGDKFFVHVYLDPRNPPKGLRVELNDGSWEHRAYWGAANPDNVAASAAMRPVGPLPAAGKWVRLEVDAQEVGLTAGAAVNGLSLVQVDGTVYWDSAGILTSDPTVVPSDYHLLAAWEQVESANLKMNAGKLPAAVQDVLRIEAPARTADQKAALRSFFVEHVYAAMPDAFDALQEEWERLKERQRALEEAIPTALVMEELAEPRDTFVRVRGDLHQLGEKVTGGVPKFLPPLPAGAKPDRLGLAKWLTAPDHPLTARVTVNRYWAQYFGRGLVKTSEEFGSQGEWPSHPELLDWLAIEFIRTGWDVKRMQKLIVTSNTYRQSSRVDPEGARRDPENRLFARGSRFRVPAELIRDTALAAGGLLDWRIGGPSVRPYQPVGLWEAIAPQIDPTSQAYFPSTGADLYRRGLYTYWKRSLPPPALATFDAPSREVCTDRRPRTNTPLQALVLLNDPVYVECARALAQRTLREAGPGLSDRLAYAFKLCTARDPTPKERAVLQTAYGQQLAYFQGDPHAADQLLRVGDWPVADGVDPCELAAWTAVGNLLLNLDETITRE